jgi:branched-chain amino acid transport system ATP-binding protein
MFALFPRLKERCSSGRHHVRRRAADARHRPRADEQARCCCSTKPSLGLAPIIIQQIFDIIEQLRRDGVTVFLVEQNANQALKSPTGLCAGERPGGDARDRRSAVD